MKKQTDTEVIINGKRYTVCGYESEEYLQRVASYINNKYTEIKQLDAYRTLEAELKNVLLNINITDDYFKLKQRMQENETESDIKSNEIFELKHEVISLQSRLEALEKEIEKLRVQNLEEQKKVVRLETELAERKKVH